MTVYLVGAGPGDPGLITRRGADLLAQADVVVHDRLSAAELLDLAPDAERVDVGKQPGQTRVAQGQINEMLVDLGRRHEVVVRLKGGDPFVFARGGEEAAALEDAGIEWEVVPGITSAIAVPAYAGIPITQRFSSTSFTVVTGHEDPSVGADGSVDWDAVARVGGTIVVLMGVGRIEAICDRLIAAGRPPDTPAAAVQWGTRPEQRTVRATLGTLADMELGTPSTIVIGAVADLDLAWFESRPLFGKTIVVTRARAQASALLDRLSDLGAAVIEAPAIRIADPADGGRALRDAASRLADFDWVIVTSPNGARRLLAAVRDARAFGGAKVAAIGPGTAAALREGNVEADLVPERFVAEGLLDAFADGPGRVLVARAAVARDALPAGLVAKGWDIEVVEAYRTEAATLDVATIDAIRSADVVTFTSSSTVTNFLDAAGRDAAPTMVAAIGPITARTARDAGLTVDVEASEHSIDGLVAALVDELGPG
jgi:uroporphyrinogen III methyltransferase/synthase